MNKKKFYISTPIYYPSAKLHIGHALTTTFADVISRYKKMMNYDVFFLTGSDEYGQKIEKSANEKKMKPIKYTNKIVFHFKNLWKKMNIENNDFIRTTESRHYKTVQYIFQKIYQNGDIYKSKYEGFYCVSCESFFTEYQAKNEKICPDCGKELEIVKEESYFFKMSKYQEKLLKYIKNNKNFIKPESRRNEMIKFIEQGLDDLSISRTSFNWGIPIIFDKKHVIYVWFDALINYLTALNYSENGILYKEYWKKNNEIIHLIGKDIVRFHSIIWPTILMAANIKLPTTIFAHGWLLFDGDKISKSKGNIIDPFILINKYGSDSLRYFLMRELSFEGTDFNYSEDFLIKKLNNDLVNDYGNLINRTISMIEKYFSGIVPGKSKDFFLEKEIIELSENVVKNFIIKMNNFEVSNSLKEIFKLIYKANKFIEESTPWKLAKNNEQEKLKTTMYQLMEIIRISTALLSPFLVETKEKVKKQIGLLNNKWFEINNLKFGKGPSGYKVKKESLLFPRIYSEKD